VLQDEATPLHWAAYGGQLDIVHMLLKAGAAVNATRTVRKLAHMPLKQRTNPDSKHET
jgi:ankyrin repeat protein